MSQISKMYFSQIFGVKKIKILDATPSRTLRSSSLRTLWFKGIAPRRNRKERKVFRKGRKGS